MSIKDRKGAVEILHVEATGANVDEWQNESINSALKKKKFDFLLSLPMNQTRR